MLYHPSAPLPLLNFKLHTNSLKESNPTAFTAFCSHTGSTRDQTRGFAYIQGTQLHQDPGSLKLYDFFTPNKWGVQLPTRDRPFACALRVPHHPLECLPPTPQSSSGANSLHSARLGSSSAVAGQLQALARGLAELKTPESAGNGFSNSSKSQRGERRWECGGRREEAGRDTEKQPPPPPPPAEGREGSLASP